MGYISVEVGNGKGGYFVPCPKTSYYVPEEIEFDVTPEDIEQGHCRSRTKCAVAIALQRKLQVPFVTVGHYETQIEFVDGGGHKVTGTYETPSHVDQWLHEFDDNYGRCQPFKSKLILMW